MRWVHCRGIYEMRHFGAAIDISRQVKTSNLDHSRGVGLIWTPTHNARAKTELESDPPFSLMDTMVLEQHSSDFLQSEYILRRLSHP